MRARRLILPLSPWYLYFKSVEMLQKRRDGVNKLIFRNRDDFFFLIDFTVNYALILITLISRVFSTMR